MIPSAVRREQLDMKLPTYQALAMLSSLSPLYAIEKVAKDFFARGGEATPAVLFRSGLNS
jgi:hypothetical protein